MNVVIWARVSSREQAEGYSLDAQIRINRDKAQREGWNVLREFVIAESARRGAARVAFNEMYQWVKKNAKRMKIDAVLAHKLDRICRNMRDAVRMQELEDTVGVKMLFVDNEFGPGAAGALSFNVMAAISQYYSDNLRQEVRKGQEEKIRQGWMPCGVAYGYMNTDDRDEPIQPHPEKSKLVVRVFQLYSQGGLTFDMIGEQLHREGYIYRPSMPRMSPGSISYMLANRFYVGDIVWKGQIYPGKHRPLVDRRTFQICRNLLKGKNRRTRRQTHALANGLFLCDHCGSMITGERIRRKLKSGGVRVHTYYRCANNHRGDDHPKVRWREADLEDAIAAELDTMRMPTPETAEWFRDSLNQSFGQLRGDNGQQKRILGRKKVELEKKSERLLSLYLEGHLDAGTFQDQSATLQGHLRELEEGIGACRDIDPACRDMAVKVFDFTQQAAEVWRGSKTAGKQRILRAISLNRTLNDVNLVLEKRKPFSFLTERLPVRTSRGDWI
ncbi:MAG: recombinase family protein [Planctomycetota bacterium]